jgi:diguanylate cyclase (GGDEF)-like protein
MVYGAVLYSRVDVPSRRRQLLWAAALIYGVVSVILSPRLGEIVVWQSPVTVLGMTYCAYLLLTLAPDRRSLGSRVTGVCFSLIAVVWTLYIFAFGSTQFMVPGISRSGLQVVVSYNTWVDLLLQVILGYAMVVLLMEDAKRDVDTAHRDLATAHEQLRTASFHDTLTGALNRRAFVEGVGLDEAHAFGGSVVALDLDNLKIVNDSFGHASGDRLLRRLAEVVRSIVRPSDTLYRWGGDEFLLVLPGAHASDVQPRVEDVISQSNLLRVREANPDHLRLLVSVGSADFTGSADLEAAIERADNAMYAQKAQRKLNPMRSVDLRALPSA